MVVMAKGGGVGLGMAILVAVSLLALLAVTPHVGFNAARGAPTVLAQRSSLPPHWHKGTDSHGKPYYWNRVLATSSWDPPNPDGSLATVQPHHDSSEDDAADDQAAESKTSSAAADDEVASADSADEVASADSAAADDEAAAIDAYDQDTSSSKPAAASAASSLHGASSTQYQVVNTGSDDDDFSDYSAAEDAAADNIPFDTSSEGENDPAMDDEASNDDSPDNDDADWGPDSSESRSSAARQKDWDSDYPDQQPALEVNTPVQLHPVQQLAPTAAPAAEGAEGDDEEKAISDITGYPDWPKDLPGAYGDDTSWIVGEHREPLWSDSMTNGCGLTTPCEKGRADRGHAFQTTYNAFNDKRRTFDPYAQATEEGRANYPWDPSKDPKYYGKADCSDGVLRDECFEKPTADELDKKKQEWKRKYDEWYTGKQEGEGEEDSDGPVKAKTASQPMLNVPSEVMPWAKSSIPGLGKKAARGHYAGGEPVASSFKRVVKKVEGDFSAGIQSLSFSHLRELERKFLRARQSRHAALTQGEEEMLAEIQADEHSSSSSSSSSSRVKKTGAHKQAAAAAAAAQASSSIWESPLAVAAKGLFGGGEDDDKSTATKHATKSQEKLLRAESKAEARKGKGPLPPALSDAAALARSAGRGRDAQAKQSTLQGWQEAVLQKGVMRKETTTDNLEDALKARDDKMLKASGLSWSKLRSLEDAASDLEKDLASAHKAPMTSKTSKASAVAKPQLKGWEEKEIQKGTLRHESVEQNLKAALGRRELNLLEHKAGWKSPAELEKALTFADNLEAAISTRRTEEKGHPLMPSDARKALKSKEENALKSSSSSSSLASSAALGASKRAAEKGEAEKGEAEEGEAEEGEAEGEDSTFTVRSPSAEHHKALKAEVEEAADRRVVQAMREEMPIVDAYEAQVKDDEEEYEGEMSEEQLTLNKMHRDQAKLTHAIDLEHPPTKHKGEAKGTRDTTQDEGDAVAMPSVGALQKLRVLASASNKHGKQQQQQQQQQPAHGLSAAAADRDIDSFFDAQQPTAVH
eukprot:CAMPEP_0181302812 /NCGR_PEP_ID=MMETSP1101-20121128/8203_1 /TAXON_ID=46948 /ORGANISM="Rhodomonas abbreviata, Strain Caron Lab Isolate" /LENGTH=1036 /DNA_ID=CAMNT_0023408301 /DNA_START=10 /DNA_END=3120 /DNA_ORIENTATION=+